MNFGLCSVAKVKLTTYKFATLLVLPHISYFGTALKFLKPSKVFICTDIIISAESRLANKVNCFIYKSCNILNVIPHSVYSQTVSFQHK